MERRTKRCCMICCILATIILLLLIITLVILYFTILKPKQPEVVATPVSLRRIDVGVFPLLILRVTLGVDVFIKNRNYAGFRYGNTTTSVYYRGGVVGQAPIAAGEIKARGTQDISATIELLVDKMISNPNFLPDYLSGMLNLTSASRVEGKAIILKVFKLHASTSVDCDITIFVRSRNSSSNCISNIKF